MHVVRPIHESPRAMWISKLLLRVLATVLAAALLGLAANYVSGLLLVLSPIIFLGAPAAVSLCWNLAEGICILARGGHRGIHPGANVALDLLIWLGLVVATVFTAYIFGPAGILGGVSGAFDTDGDDDDYDLYNFNRDYRRGTYSDSSDYDYWGSDTLSSGVSFALGLDELQKKTNALIGLGATLVVVHFVTFVIACYETNVRNKAAKALPRTEATFSVSKV